MKGRGHSIAARSRGGILLSVAASLAGCAGTRALPTITVGAAAVDLAWSADEKAKPAAMRPLHESEAISVLWLRAGKSEPVHSHPNHDVVAVVVSGEGTLHIDGKALKMGAGDSFTIPKGAVHWVEMAEGTEAQALLITAPKMGDPKKFQKLEP
jgi:quercetin dioxygenase-like cupin family protein